MEIIDARIGEFAARYQALYPAAVKCLLTDREGCLTLVWAVLDRASAGWHGFTMTSDGLRLLQHLRRQLLQPPVSLRRRSPPGENVLPGAAPAVA